MNNDGDDEFKQRLDDLSLNTLTPDIPITGRQRGLQYRMDKLRGVPEQYCGVDDRQQVLNGSPVPDSMLDDVMSSTDVSVDPILGAMAEGKDPNLFFASSLNRRGRENRNASDKQRSASRREKITRSRGSYAAGVSKLIDEIKSSHREIHQTQVKAEARRQHEEQRLVALYGREAYDRARQAAEAKWGVSTAAIAAATEADEANDAEADADAASLSDTAPASPATAHPDVQAVDADDADELINQLQSGPGRGPSPQDVAEADPAVGELMEGARDAVRLEALDRASARMRAQVESAAGDRDVIGKLFQLPPADEGVNERAADGDSDDEYERIVLDALLREGARAGAGEESSKDDGSEAGPAAGQGTDHPVLPSEDSTEYSTSSQTAGTTAAAEKPPLAPNQSLAPPAWEELDEESILSFFDE